MRDQCNRQVGAEVYSDSCIQYWLQNLLYYDAPRWIQERSVRRRTEEDVRLGYDSGRKPNVSL